MSFRSGACHKYPAQLRMMYTYHERTGHSNPIRLANAKCDLSFVSVAQHQYVRGNRRPIIHLGSNELELDGLTMAALRCSTDSSTLHFVRSSSLNSKSNNANPNKPSVEQIERISSFLEEQIPIIFKEDLKTEPVHEQVVFEDNIRKVQTCGIFQFRKSINILKIWFNVRYLQTSVQVLSITKDLENGQIRIRFRIIGEKGILKLFRNIRSKLSGIENGVQESRTQDWIDVISTFTVNTEGQITRIVCDNVLMDENKSILEEFPVKVAAMFGLMHDF